MPAPMIHRNRISGWQRRTLYFSTAILAGSGLLWFTVHQLGWPGIALADMNGMPSPWEPWLMKAHGAAVMVMLFMVGRLSATHVVRGWRLARTTSNRRRFGGLGLLAGLALLALTGYALYYLVPEEGREVLDWGHTGLGLAWTGLLLWHRRRA